MHTPEDRKNAGMVGKSFEFLFRINSNLKK